MTAPVIACPDGTITVATLRDVRLRAERGWPPSPDLVARLAAVLEDAVDAANAARSVTDAVDDVDGLPGAFAQADAALKESEDDRATDQQEHDDAVTEHEAEAARLQQDVDDAAASADELRARAEKAEHELAQLRWVMASRVAAAQDAPSRKRRRT